MTIAYDEKTLWRMVNQNWEQIQDEVNWMNHYIATGEVECVEDCVRNIIDSCNAILEHTTNLKSDPI